MSELPDIGGVLEGVAKASVATGGLEKAANPEKGSEQKGDIGSILKGGGFGAISEALKGGGMQEQKGNDTPTPTQEAGKNQEMGR